MSYFLCRLLRYRKAKKDELKTKAITSRGPSVAATSKNQRKYSTKHHLSVKRIPNFTPRPINPPAKHPATHQVALANARNRLQKALDHSHAPRTSKNYSDAVKRYIKFASSIGFPEEDALPASEELVLLWAAEGLGRTGPGTAKQNLSALRAWHIKNGHEWSRPAAIPFISKALAEFWPRESKKPQQRPPVTSHMMSMLAHSWKNGSPKEICALAIALTAWTGQCRLGELLPESQDIVDNARLPTRGGWIHEATSPRASQLTLPWTKTTLWQGAKVFLLDQRDPLNASLAILKHLRASPIAPKRLICEFRNGRHTEILDKQEFMELCNQVWTNNGLPRVTGHSFRIGGTTALLCSGVSPEIVKKMGRWSSDAFLLYWRSLGHVFADNAANITWRD
ncbi:hypothetical protein M408DRAFT_29947 [Serendipita vermifera MAFF 305830]|uniref:Core-binding (CB) domain-containing protein n=1 Tax=Serendipita vermifera MAFF 305830 TaxID=933852 RepID=A0A0C3ALP6_SERVB|nr:hypothetical protein M408DRAFT_29947 [Serendipita vermifera MAFF 305830]